MSSTTDRSLDALLSPISGLVESLRSSVLFSLILLGVLLLALGEFVLTGVLAGMFGIWGVTLILTSAVVYAVIEFKKS